MAGCRGPDNARDLTVCRDDGGQRVAAVIEYDGTNYCGFQRQLQESTIQAELESALRKVGQEGCTIVGAGRTDSGVHAHGQVVHFQTHWRHSWAELRQAMNALLPGDISVLRLFPVEADFHARYSAVSRSYRYVVFNRAMRSPFAERFAHHVSSYLDVRAMNQASECLVGTHDFSSFGQSPSGGHTVREVYCAHWCRQGDWMFFEIEANAFLRHMVRSVVGTLLQVGTGRIPPGEVEHILHEKDRSSAGPTASPQGLFLEQVCYRAPWHEIAR